ncbi:serine/threonine-protein phosphatase 2A activator [Neocloeon triangulifer]|uniref:serine/threonine-protein phosphatase 2A activator n=1 Tax=Neocloeon triangulifer TaxID=2078957 RepID=UPI00286F79FD|nr:serine/threonine-protein phosphatase 2A activator [Neocloeon triangulifer]
MSEIMPDDHVYVVPRKMVLGMGDMAAWTKSEAYHEYVGFIYALNDAVKGKSNSSANPASQKVEHVLELMETLNKWIDEIPPVDQPQRFGNKAFKTWFKKLTEDADVELKKMLPENKHNTITEIAPYLIQAFGNDIRIDYGTGHEMSFLFFLCCLFKIGALDQTDKTAAVCLIFKRYVEISRKLQRTYRMEPAGSHGVWSLDDYQFVPFIWGSSQLMGHHRIEPSMLATEAVVEDNYNEYLFFGCIKFILEVKTGMFAEHSNQLWNISGVDSWSKVNAGLIKMYKAEVLAKFPVIQHVLFGSLMTLKESKFKMGPGGPPRMAPPRLQRPS